MTVEQKRKRLRSILTGPEGAVAPAAYDALSAMLIERAGFPVVSIANGPVHHSFGFADVGVVTLTEQVANAARIADAVGVPVVANCEVPATRANVVRAVHEYERSGVAAIDIEDEAVIGQSAGGGVSAVASAVFVDWIKAAVDRRLDATFAIVARMENRGEPYEQLLERCMAVIEAGADALWIGHLSPEAMRRIVADVPRPMVGVPRPPRQPAAFLAMGYKIAVLPGSVPRAACWGMEMYLRTLRASGSDAEFFRAHPDAEEVSAWFDAIGTDFPPLPEATTSVRAEGT